MSGALLAGAGFVVGALSILIYFVALALRPQWVRVLHGSGLFFTGLGLIQLAFAARAAQPASAWFNLQAAVVALVLAAAAQAYSILRNRKAWDGVDRRTPASGGATPA